MTDKVDGVAGPGEFLVGDLDFFTVASTVAIANSGDITDPDQIAFDKCVEVISQKGQPVLLTAPAANEFKFAVEHVGLWTEAGATDPKAEALKDALEAVVGGTFTITYANTL